MSIFVGFKEKPSVAVLLGQMQAEDPGDRPDLQVNSQACLASPQEIP